MVYGEYTVVLKTLMDDPECMSAINKAMSTYPLYEQRTKGEHIPVYIPTREELNRKILNRYIIRLKAANRVSVMLLASPHKRKRLVTSTKGTMYCFSIVFILFF